MKSQQTFEQLQQPSCRVCFENNGKLISPCQCRGSVKYIHEDCLKLWVQKSLNNETLSCKNLGYNKYCINCQLCKGQIDFKMIKKKTCKKCQQIYAQIDQQHGKFICLISSIFMLTCIVFVVFYFTINLVIEDAIVQSLIFFIVFDIIVLILWIRILYLLIRTYFISRKYFLGSFQIEIIK